MTQPEYWFHRPESDEDIEQLYELMNIVFKGEDVDKIVKMLLDHYPESNRRHLLAVKHGDETVAGLIIIPQTWVLDGFDLRVAEMGCVATHPDHRRKRLQHILNEKFDEQVKKEGLDLCALAGVPFFYRQFGYEYTVELDHSTRLPLSNIPDYPKAEAVPFSENDIPAAKVIFEASQGKYPIHEKRTLDVWRAHRKTGLYYGGPVETVSLFKDNILIAYLKYSCSQKEKTITLKEAAVASPAAVESALAYLKDYGKRKGLEKLVSGLGYLDEISMRLAELGGEQSHPYAWQVKILDYLELFRKLTPLLESRLRESKFSGLSETLNFNFRKFNIVVTFKDGVVESTELGYDNSDRTIGLNPTVFPQLLLGYRSREELEYVYPDFKIQETHKELTDVLFPKRAGYIHFVY
ncbi:MAG: GNAT family N-acetyltransferase [Candidatus Bathyarchaeota archaeon]|nr:GNAT family N-acetyltransferase [Candidatus Bathyarchaeota archaeon]